LSSCGPTPTEIVKQRGITNLCWFYLNFAPDQEIRKAAIAELKARNFDLKQCVTMDYD